MTNQYHRNRLTERNATELIGLARGMAADGVLNDREVEYLRKWLAANGGATQDPLLGLLLDRIEIALADGVLDDEERADLLSVMAQLAGEEPELGEILKPTTLPFDDPPPVLEFAGKRYCFTGTFVFGQRKDCEAAVKALGAETAGLSGKTDVLVIGEYATDSWAHSSYGRKIEKACNLRDEGAGLVIVSESHWKAALPE